MVKEDGKRRPSNLLMLGAQKGNKNLNAESMHGVCAWNTVIVMNL